MVVQRLQRWWQRGGGAEVELAGGLMEGEVGATLAGAAPLHKRRK